MNNSLILKSGLLLIILTIDLVMSSSVGANIVPTMAQKDLTKQSSSQKQWEQFRQRQDERMLQQQQRLEQFRLQDQQRQQQPFGQSQLNQLRLQQRQQMETLRLQQKLRQPQ